jgi:hypothetical protein
VASLTSTQLAWRGRVESVLRVVGPGLDLVLAAGDRLSRAVDHDEAEALPPARRASAGELRRPGAVG